MNITHRFGSYPIHFQHVATALQALPDDRFIITDENVARCVLGQLDDRTLVIPPGEGSKCIATYARCQSWLASHRAGRRSTIVALGGGVIGDLVGFVASSYMRGVPFVQFPTTLLSQVDSSVGGKVGIDLPEGKNLVGAFYPPSQVCVDTNTLRSLPDREFSSGLAEVWKYGYILDAQLAHQLRATSLNADSESLEQVVRRCIELKANVVQEDEFETTGLRAVLNFGHTVGHAIEKVVGYGEILHGEAISIGMVIEAKLAEQIGVAESGLHNEIAEDLATAGLPVTHEVLGRPSELIDAMRQDKKAIGGSLAFSLVHRLGECKLYTDIREADVRYALGQV